MDLLEQWGVPVAVGALLMVTLFMASVVRRYQEHHAMVRQRVRRLERGINTIVAGLGGLASVPLSRELRVALRGDVLARYTRIGALYRRYPGIKQHIADAEAALNSEGAPAVGSVGPIESEQAFRDLLQVLDELSGFLEQGDSVAPIPKDVNAIFRRELGDRRAEINARYHLVQCAQLQREGDIKHARAHVTALIQVLKTRGPNTDFVRELYSEAQAALDAVMNGRTLGADDASEDDPPATESAA